MRSGSMLIARDGEACKSICVLMISGECDSRIDGEMEPCCGLSAYGLFFFSVWAVLFHKPWKLSFCVSSDKTKSSDICRFLYDNLTSFSTHLINPSRAQL